MKDGGPTFPRPLTTLRTSAASEESQYLGMSLRDYFAAQALPQVTGEELPLPTPASIAREAYRLADAMLAERSKP